MRAVLCSAFTGPADLRIGEIDEPKPAGDEILIAVHAASVSFMDHLMVSGLYQMRPPTPFVPGTEAAGIVVAVGANVTRFQPGDRVACGSWTGGYAERMVARESKSVRLPAGVAFETAATVWHNYGTAYYALVEMAQAQRGETVFVSGAAGGVGLAAVDLARHLGLRVIAGVGSDDKAALVRDYGASDVINYRSEDLRAGIKSISSGEGVDICFDNVGGAIFEQNGAADEVGRTDAADRFHQRPDSVGADEPAALEELFHCRCLYRRLGREIPRTGGADE